MSNCGKRRPSIPEENYCDSDSDSMSDDDDSSYYDTSTDDNSGDESEIDATEFTEAATKSMWDEVPSSFILRKTIPEF